MLPHDKVFTRLKQSKTHGIGVFAICDIPKNTTLFVNDNTKMVWIEASKIKELPKSLKKLYEDFCVTRDGKSYGCPVNFDRMPMSWYLNHSKKPNVTCDTDYNFHTKRDIVEGEELFVDYDTYTLKSF